MPSHTKYSLHLLHCFYLIAGQLFSRIGFHYIWNLPLYIYGIGLLDVNAPTFLAGFLLTGLKCICNYLLLACLLEIDFLNEFRIYTEKNNPAD